MKRGNRTSLTIILVLLTAVLLTATGCGSDQKNFEIDPAKLVSDVLENVSFASEMQELDRDSLAVTYTIEEGVEVTAYLAGGALSDEMIVFSAPDEAVANQTLAHAKEHIAERSELFAAYAPAEVVKLEKAYVIQKGRYVIVCVTEDIDRAKEIINQHF